MFIVRIKETPKLLSEKIYHKKIQEALKKNQESLSKLSEKEFVFAKHATFFIGTLLYLFFAFYYYFITCRFPTNAVVCALSALQIGTVFINLVQNVKVGVFNQNIEDYKFYRGYFLFNVILDYIYYPLTLYMLITK